MPSHCKVCGSQLRSERATCWNKDAAGVPCLGMSDTDAALQAAHNAFTRSEIDLATFERRIESALRDPPRRRFGVITVLR